MNKILVTKRKLTCDDEGVLIEGRTLTFNHDNEYLLEYIDDGTYNLKMVIKANIRLIEVSFDRNRVNNNKYIIDNGSLDLIKFSNDLKVLENDDIRLSNPACLVNYHLANICRGEERYTIDINHLAKETSSKIVNRSVALKNSIIDFIINSKVDDKAYKSVLDQNTRIVTMGDVDAHISPNMFINLDDVEAKHGSVIGSFNDEEVFYLMSKGISYKDTLKLLIKGFILGNLNVDFETRQRIINIIDVYWR